MQLSLQLIFQDHAMPCLTSPKSWLQEAAAKFSGEAADGHLCTLGPHHDSKKMFSSWIEEPVLSFH